MLTGVPVPDLPAAYDAMNLLQSFQPGSVVLTLGEKGLLFSQRDKQSSKWSPVEHVEAEKVEAIDSTVSAWYSQITTQLLIRSSPHPQLKHVLTRYYNDASPFTYLQCNQCHCHSAGSWWCICWCPSILPSLPLSLKLNSSWHVMEVGDHSQSYCYG